jgi:hypothetical protein
MAMKQKRTALLRQGRKSVTLKLGEGHVWEKDAHDTLGHPLYDARKEQQLFERLLKKYRAKGFNVVEDSGLVEEAGPKKPRGMSERTRRWVQDADQILEMWGDDNYDNYDNYKDAVSDALDVAPSTGGAKTTREAPGDDAPEAREGDPSAHRKEPESADQLSELLSPPTKKGQRKPSRHRGGEAARIRERAAASPSGMTRAGVSHQDPKASRSTTHSRVLMLLGRRPRDDGNPSAAGVNSARFARPASRAVRDPRGCAEVTGSPGARGAGVA